MCPAGPQRGAFGNPSATPCHLGLHPASAEPDTHQRLLQVGGAEGAESRVLGQVQRLLPSPAHPCSLQEGTLTPAAASLMGSLPPRVRAAGERAGLFFSDFPRSQQGFCGCPAHSPE